MFKRQTLSALLAATLATAATTTARADDPTARNNQDLQKQIEALQQQVRRLEEQQARRAVTPAYTTKDVDAAVSSVIQDADRRSKLLAETGGFLGGWQDDKFTIRSADGNYTLSPSIQFQFRYDTVWSQGVRANGDDNTDSGFEVRRLKLGIDGNAFSKDFYYNFVWATDRKTGNLVNEEAYVTWKFADPFSVKVGQYKELIYQESSVSSKRLLAVDRTLVDQVFFGGDAYIQGVELDYGTDAVQALVGFSDGYNSFDTNFQDPPVNPFDFGLYARAQYKVFGDWKNYSDMTALRNKKDLLVVGAGGDWSQSGDTNTYRHAVDAQWETGPLALFGAFIGRYIDTSGGGGSTWDWGFVAQAAYMVNAQWELFGRYDYFTLDNTAPGAEDQFHEITLGLNYYIRNQNAKITLDAGWLPNGSPSSQDGIGILANDGRNEYYIRAQFQLLL